MAVAKRVLRLGHFLVGISVLKKVARVPEDLLVGSSGEPATASFQHFGSLGGIARDNDGLTEARGRLLNPAGVAQNAVT